MKKLFLLLAFTGIVGAASATSVVALTKGTVITLGDGDKKQEKKKCDKKACCKSKEAHASSGCSAAKTEAKADNKGASTTTTKASK